MFGAQECANNHKADHWDTIWTSVTMYDSEDFILPSNFSVDQVTLRSHESRSRKNVHCMKVPKLLRRLIVEKRSRHLSWSNVKTYCFGPLQWVSHWHTKRSSFAMMLHEQSQRSITMKILQMNSSITIMLADEHVSLQQWSLAAMLANNQVACNDAHERSVWSCEQANAIMMIHLKKTHNHLAGDCSYVFEVRAMILTLTTHTRVNWVWINSTIDQISFS